MRSLFTKKSTQVAFAGFAGAIALLLVTTTMIANTGRKVPLTLVLGVSAGAAIAAGIAGSVLEMKEEAIGKSSVFPVSAQALETEEFQGYQVQVQQLEHPYLEQDAQSYQQIVRLAAGFPAQPLSPQQVQALAQSPEIAQQLQDLITEEAIDHASTNPTAPQDDQAGLSSDVLPSPASTFTAPAEIENLWASEPPDAWESQIMESDDSVFGSDRNGGNGSSPNGFGGSDDWLRGGDREYSAN